MQCIVKVTSACNLACSYCSEGERPLETLSFDTYKIFIKQLPSLLTSIGDKEVNIVWHGGEPLLVGTKWIEAAIEFTNQELYNYKVSYSVQTNGTLIDHEWARVLKKYDIGVGISLDGYEKLHDAYRITKDGQGTYRSVIEHIKLLQEYRIVPSVLMVINSKEAVDTDALWQVITELGVNIKIHPVVPVGYANNRMVDSKDIFGNYTETLQVLFKKLLFTESSITIQPISNILTAILTGESIRECSYSGRCTYHIMTLYPNGDVGFCGRMTNADKEYIYGNILTTDICSLYYSEVAHRVRHRQEILQAQDCANCNIWKYCHGGCTVDALSSYGNINTKYHYCDSYKELIRYFMTEGLEELKRSLVNQKVRYRLLIDEKNKLIKGLNDER